MASMKKFIPILLFLLSACAQTQIPIVESTSRPTIPPTVIPSATAELPTATVPPTAEVLPTDEFVNERTSPIDGMPQVYITAGTFHMGGMDVRRAPNELPDHDVTLDAFWMDQLEVTNAMFLLCVQAGACETPQNFKSQRRTEYFNNNKFNDYPLIYVTWGQAKAYFSLVG